MNSWLVADGDDGDQWNEFHRDGVVRITGRQRLGNLQQYTSARKVEQALREKYREEFRTKNPAIKARLCFNFGHEVMIGDEIFVRHRRKTLLGYGVAERPPRRAGGSQPKAAYFFDEDHSHYPHAIKVCWLKTGEFRIKNVVFPMNLIATVGNPTLSLLRRAMGVAQGPHDQRGIYPDELRPGQNYYEGAVAVVRVNRYERDAQARAACLAKMGEGCIVCGLRFVERYGKIGRGFIHVHHLKPIAKVGRRYRINPETDLVPVCPNCHAMLHRPEPPLPPLSVADLKARLQTS